MLIFMVLFVEKPQRSKGKKSRKNGIALEAQRSLPLGHQLGRSTALQLWEGKASSIRASRAEIRVRYAQSLLSISLGWEGKTSKVQPQDPQPPHAWDPSGLIGMGAEYFFLQVKSKLSGEKSIKTSTIR